MTKCANPGDNTNLFLLFVIVMLNIVLINTTVAQVAGRHSSPNGAAKVLVTNSKTDNGIVIASDNFNRANETPFSVGGNWGRTVAGNYDGFSNLVNNQIVSTSKEGIYYWLGAGSFENTRQFARGKVVQKDGEVGLVLLGGPDQAIMVSWGPPGVGNTLYIYWYAGGLDQSRLATGSSALANGDVIEAVLDGGVIYALVNGVTVMSVANTTTLTSGTPGFITYLDLDLPGQVSILDDWEAGTPVTYTISGTITEEGTGLGGVLVTASGGFSGSTTTAGNGAFAITGVRSDATGILLTPTLAGHTMSPLTRMIDGPLTGDVSGEDFTSTLNTNNVLTINTTHGSVTRNPDQPTYEYGTDVTLTPVADEGYHFLGWRGDVPAGHQTDNPLHVTMDQNRTIAAMFNNGGNVIASDDFNRTDESPLVAGGNWQQPFEGGYVNLIGNQIESAPAEGLYYWQGTGTFDNTKQFARERVVQASGEVGLILLGASNQAIVLAWNGGTLYIYWYSGGSYQGNLATAPSTLANGDIVEAILDGGTIYGVVNGVTVSIVANTTTLSSGTPGFETYQTGGILDDWEAGTPGTEDPLPIQLGSFTGTVLPDRNVLLTWVTLSEVNNFGFYVHRKRVNDDAYVELPNIFVAGCGTTNDTHTYTFTDHQPGPGTWMYRLKQVDLDGTVHFPQSIKIELSKSNMRKEKPTEYSISQNYPNPFNPVTTIRYGLPQKSNVMLSVFNTLGQKVAVLVQGEQEAGSHEVKFDASNLSSGVHFYRLEAGDFLQTRKLLILR